MQFIQPCQNLTKLDVYFDNLFDRNVAYKIADFNFRSYLFAVYNNVCYQNALDVMLLVPATFAVDAVEVAQLRLDG